MAADSRPPDTRELYASEGPEVYCFDFTDCPTLTSGGAISAPTVTVDVNRVTLGTPTVLTADFTEYDRNGNVVATVAAGKGVKVTVTGVSKGQCEVKCQVTGSDGQKPVAAANFIVRA